MDGKVRDNEWEVKAMAEYSATMVSQSFWFNEFKRYVNLVNDGQTTEKIREQVVDQNIFQQSTLARAQDMFNTVKRRVDTLDTDYLELFITLDVSSQKLVNLISIMKLDRLFDEFMYDVYRGELVLGDSQLHDYEVEAFFSRKQAENAQIATWTDETIERLIRIFKTFPREAGLMCNRGTYDQVQRPLLNLRLESLLQGKNERRILAVLLGR